MNVLRVCVVIITILAVQSWSENQSRWEPGENSIAWLSRLDFMISSMSVSSTTNLCLPCCNGETKALINELYTTFTLVFGQKLTFHFAKKYTI